jgi:hypothetical protein
MKPLPTLNVERYLPYIILINLTEEEMKDIILSRYQKTDSKALTKREASDLIDYLNHLKEAYNDNPKDCRRY